MQQPAADLERRRPVWEAMSAVFLDTEIDEPWLGRIVTALVASGYADADLNRIFWDEVCPHLHWNLLSVAGEWAAFDMDVVEFQVLHRPAGLARRWASWVGGGRVARDGWRRVTAAVVAQRANGLAPHRPAA